MSDHQCLAVEEVVYHSEWWRPFVSANMDVELGQVGEQWAITRSFTLADVGTAIDALDGRRSLRWTEAAAAVEQYMPAGNPVARLSEHRQWAEAYLGASAAQWADVGYLRDAYEGTPAGALVERGRFDELFVGLAQAGQVVDDRARVAEAYRGVRSARLAEAGTFAEHLATRRKVATGDAAAFAEQWQAGAQAILVVREQGRFAEAYQGVGKPSASIEEAGWLGEVYRMALPAVTSDGHTAHRVGSATAWTANTDTWGMSRYTGWQFNSLAVVDGVLYGASDAGLHRLDAEDDAGKAILAHIQTGKEAIAGEMVMGLRTIYAGGVASGALQVTVDAAPKGRPAFYTYPFEPRLADDFAAMRARLGRGLQSRYWQVAVGNDEAGAYFLIDTLSVLDSAGSRRV